jgi:hypothetical protein
MPHEGSLFLTLKILCQFVFEELKSIVLRLQSRAATRLLYLMYLMEASVEGVSIRKNTRCTVRLMMPSRFKLQRGHIIYNLQRIDKNYCSLPERTTVAILVERKKW